MGFLLFCTRQRTPIRIKLLAKWGVGLFNQEGGL